MSQADPEVYHPASALQCELEAITREERMARHRAAADAKWSDAFTQSCVTTMLARSLEVVRQEFIDAAYDGVASAESCDSPLEWAFFSCWEMFRFRVPVQYSHPCEMALMPQVQAGRYRVDFQVVPCFDIKRNAPGVSGYPLLAIELDGHEWHGKTKEQETKRNRRDRDLAQAQWQVLHYSGSEFYRDPYACVEQAYAFANKIAVECWYADCRRGVA